MSIEQNIFCSMLTLLTLFLLCIKKNSISDEQKKWANLGILITVNFTYFKYGKKNEVNKVSIEQNIFCSMLTSAHPFFTLNKIYIYYKNKDAQICSFAHLAHSFFITYKKKLHFSWAKWANLGILITVNSTYFI